MSVAELESKPESEPFGVAEFGSELESVKLYRLRLESGSMF